MHEPLQLTHRLQPPLESEERKKRAAIASENVRKAYRTTRVFHWENTSNLHIGVTPIIETFFLPPFRGTDETIRARPQS